MGQQQTDAVCETLMNFRRVIQNKNRDMLTKGVCFHQDNARPHTARATTDLVNQYG